MSCFGRMTAILRGEHSINHVAMVLQLSVLTNVLIVATMGVIAIASHSLALLSALAENMVDLVVQSLLAYAGTRKSFDAARFPVGTARFEPATVIVASSAMVLIAALFIKEGITKIIDGVTHDKPAKPELSLSAVVIVTLAISTKIFLMFYSRWVLRFNKSVAVEAIQDDNRNDIVSNAFAIIAYIIASANDKLWYIDPAGAILVFLVILVAWIGTGKEQILQLVGVAASPEFIDQIKELCRTHHAQLALDILRAYHSGSKYIVELEVVVPADMTVKEAHEIALQLQFKVEQLDDAERAFVHVDYKPRSYDEHIVSKESNALTRYTDLNINKQDEPSRGNYTVVPQEERDFPQAINTEIKVVVTPSSARRAWSFRSNAGQVHCTQ